MNYLLYGNCASTTEMMTVLNTAYANHKLEREYLHNKSWVFRKVATKSEKQILVSDEAKLASKITQ